MSAAIQSMHDDLGHPWRLQKQGWPRVPASSATRGSGYRFSVRSQTYRRQAGSNGRSALLELLPVGPSTDKNPDFGSEPCRLFSIIEVTTHAIEQMEPELIRACWHSSPHQPIICPAKFDLSTCR